ncbi:hypothetical protein DK880_00591 [Candidatus Cardinium hertigii]|uniref:Uncharacterized protein n=1 Tax=Candidatus Cardinium hertigii TaxID=247481 RepID=A0A2Z3L959_9BACT|nr:hypothetical protein DK880_00591 [Candidatus Cardinium hertigii]
MLPAGLLEAFVVPTARTNPSLYACIYVDYLYYLLNLTGHLVGFP